MSARALLRDEFCVHLFPFSPCCRRLKVSELLTPSHYFAPYPAGLSTVKTFFDTLLLNVSPDSIFATTPEGRIIYWLKGSETMFGHTSVEAALAPLECLIAPAMKSHDVFGRDRRGSGL